MDDFVEGIITGTVLGSCGSGGNRNDGGEGCLAALLIIFLALALVGGCVSQCGKKEKVDRKSKVHEVEKTAPALQVQRTEKDEEKPSKWEKAKKIIHTLTE